MTPLHLIISNSEKILEQIKNVKIATNLTYSKIMTSKRSYRKIKSIVTFFEESIDLTKNILNSS